MPDFSYIRKAIKPKGKLVYEYNPLYNYRPEKLDGEIDDLITTGSSQLDFDLEHPVDIVCQSSYDGSVNLILNDDKNQPRLINTRFTPRENNTYERIDRTGNTDTNLYDESEFEIDSSLLKKYINIPKVNFKGVYYGGSLKVGNYVFYFKLSDGDGNETDIVAESGLVSIYMGSLNDPQSIRGGQYNENSGKAIQFILTNLDSGYDYVSVYYSRTSGADNLQRTVEAVKILNRYRIRQNICNIHVNGNEQSELIPVASLSQDFFLASAAKTQEICQNMLFLGNVKKFTPDYETLSRLSLGFVPFYESKSEEDALGSQLDETYVKGGYYDIQNIYNKVGYWNEEIYRFGVVYIMQNGSLSPVYNIRGRNNIPSVDDTSPHSYKPFKDISIDYDTQFIDNITLENSAGVCRINEQLNVGENCFRVRHFIFKAQDGLISELDKLNIKGYFFVRQKRIPTILCQAFLIGRDSYSGIPCWELQDGANSGTRWVTESFLNSKGYVVHDYGERQIVLADTKVRVGVGICPEFELNQAYYNNIFTGNLLNTKIVAQISGGLNGVPHHIFADPNDYKVSKNKYMMKAKVATVVESGLLRDGSAIFRNVAGSQSENTFQYVGSDAIKPSSGNFGRNNTTRISYQSKIPNIYLSSGAESKLKIVRGLYGPYIGFYNQNLLQSNSLINVYIPGYEENLMYEYFQMRINCEDAYYPVTQRTSLNEFPKSGEHVYRGDCFISQFTHRINRNFQDPDAPNNDVIVEESTWIDKYDGDTNSTSDINRGDLNAVRVGTYITIKCYTSTNVGLRDWDGSFPSEDALTGNKRSFYPLSPLRVDGHSKIPDSVMYNQGFSSTTGERMNFLQPAVPYIKNSFQTRVIYSDIAQTDAFKNGFRVFKGISHVDYPNTYGGITKLIEWNGDLVVIFEHAIGLAKVNQNALIPADDGTQIAIGAVKPLATTLQMFSIDFGSQWGDSICKTDAAIYGVDTIAKKIWRIGSSGLECISDFAVQKFLNENITLSEKELTPIIGVRNVKTHYNAYKRDVMFTYYDTTYGFEEKVWSLCWNELMQKFITFYSWLPSYSASIDNIYFSYDRNSSKWISKLSQSTYGSLVMNGNIYYDYNSDEDNEDILNEEYIPIFDNNASTTSRFILLEDFDPSFDYYIVEYGNYIIDSEVNDVENSAHYYGRNHYFKASCLLNKHASGVSMLNPLIVDDNFKRRLYLANRPTPEGEIYYDFELERDNFGFYKYFEIIEGEPSITINNESIRYPNTLVIKDNMYDELLTHWFLINGRIKDPINPCIQLNIKCHIHLSANNDDENNWNRYSIDNSGYYESQVFITLKDIYENTSRIRREGRWSENEHKNHLYYYNDSWHNSLDEIHIPNSDQDYTLEYDVELPTFETAFWKHGFGGLIDAQERTRPCFWYGKQHPFEFEYVVGNDNAGYKQFDNIIMSSNNVAPDSIHCTITGDSYDFSLQKPWMYFRQEATKAFYQFNGSDIVYDHDVFDKVKGYLPEKITTSSYIEKDGDDNTLRKAEAVSEEYKDTLFPLIYTRQDTFNEVEDYYRRVIASKVYPDYPNLTGGELYWDQTLDQFDICNHIKCRDIKEVGRIRGNIQYINDRWNIQISPLIVLNRNNTSGILGEKYELPKLVIDNIPQEVYDYTQGEVSNADFPPELGVKEGSDPVETDEDYIVGAVTKDCYYANRGDEELSMLDNTPWEKIANNRKEVKLMDKVMKTRIRYKGDKLAIILATQTNFNII